MGVDRREGTEDLRESRIHADLFAHLAQRRLGGPLARIEQTAREEISPACRERAAALTVNSKDGTGVSTTSASTAARRSPGGGSGEGS